MTQRNITGIKKVTVNGVDAEDILDVDIWLVTEKLNEDLVEIKFTPNTIEGIDAKQWAKCWLIEVVHDGWTDVWDSYIDDDGEGAVIPTLSVTFNITKTAAEKTTEVWTFQASKSYVSKVDPRQVEIEQEYMPGAIYVVIIGTVTITHV